MEDSVTVGPSVTSLTLDLEHFGRPSLLVGTQRDSTGQSLILRVDPQTLQTLDTLYRSSYVPKVCKAGDINLDSETDLVISLTSVKGDSSRFSSMVTVFGPDFGSADSLAVPRTVVDLILDEDKHEIWYGYTHDTTTSVSYGGGCRESNWHYIGFGGAIAFDHTELQVIGSGYSAMAFDLSDVNSDQVADVTAIWSSATSMDASGCGPAPTPTWGSAGIWQRDGALLDTVCFTQARCYDGFYRTYVRPYPRLLLADLDLDGRSEVVFSWHYLSWGGYDSLHVEAFDVSSGTLLWKRVVPRGAFGIHDYIQPYTTIAYDLDHSAPPEVLVLGGSPYYPGWTYQLLALKGDTGDSLFATPFRHVSSLNVTYQPSASELTRVIHATEGWLFRWRVDVSTAVNPDPTDLRPNSFELGPPSPNPFNAETRISYTLAYSMDIELTIFDALGRRVRQLGESHQTGGTHELIWDGKDDRGVSVASGVYFLRMSSEGDQLVRKMALLK